MGKILTEKELEEKLGCSQKTLYRYRKREHNPLPSHPLSRKKRLYDEDEVDQWFKNHRD